MGLTDKPWRPGDHPQLGGPTDKALRQFHPQWNPWIEFVRNLGLPESLRYKVIYDESKTTIH